MKIYEILFENYSEDTIIINGKIRPAKNSKGEFIADTRSGIIQFYQWFGNSVVVDSKNRPLVMFHGTSAPRAPKEFKPSYKLRPEKTHNPREKKITSLTDLISAKRKPTANRTGYNKNQAGIFFTPSEHVASSYGKSGAYYIRIEHPMIADGTYIPFFSKGDVDILKNELHKDGYIDRHGSGEYVVFSGSQVKAINSNFSKKSSLVYK